MHVLLLMAHHDINQKILSLLKMSLLARDISDSAGPHWEVGGGVHACRGVHGVLGLTMGCVPDDF